MPDEVPVFASREWLSPREAARRSGFGLDHIRAAYRTPAPGGLPSVQVGPTANSPRRIPVEGFDAWMVSDLAVLAQIHKLIAESASRKRVRRRKAKAAVLEPAT